MFTQRDELNQTQGTLVSLRNLQMNPSWTSPWPDSSPEVVQKKRKLRAWQWRELPAIKWVWALGDQNNTVLRWELPSLCLFGQTFFLSLPFFFFFFWTNILIGGEGFHPQDPLTSKWKITCLCHRKIYVYVWRAQRHCSLAKECWKMQSFLI